MDWTEIRIEIPPLFVDEAVEIVRMYAPDGLYIEDYSDLQTEAPKIAHVDLIDEALLAKDICLAVLHFYIGADQNAQELLLTIREKFTQQGVAGRFYSNSVKDEDWSNTWKDYYHATKIGHKVIVCPSWETYSPSDDEILITIDPGMAFGTGTHDTTRLCVRLLEEYSMPGYSVLDIGSGSGILSIAAVLLGCDSAIGVDIDPVAVRVAKENSIINGTSEKARFLTGNLLEEIMGSYDIVCANIVADVVIGLLPSMRTYLNRGGMLIASGILAEYEKDVVAAIKKNRLVIINRVESGGWVAIACRRR